ncbi:conserved hypothetical protein [Candidatus Protochlamydia naegleriophila]|uniref:SnoaL-like domain-containing protein n=1 Tax=Candidatus Protochlamydia naegleriophila TaxID=389348 RepID=A0A0U5JCR8_9BACT|nr:nuclear transport factor 2 family protein [Candidatus Protochlamydia naegleriophila]CUI16935.1 conserved hypothetical protein [Candidatus Protochlamydia naegleriophila]
MSNDLELRGVVEDYITCYNSFNINEMVDCFTEGCRFEHISNASDKIICNGRAELKELASKSALSFDERKQTVTKWIIAKDFVVVEIDYEAVLASDFPDGMKKGDTIKSKGISIYEIEQGKIKRLVDFS